MVVPSRALRRDCPVTLYLPARFRRADPGTRYPLLVVHDGGDYLQYAAAKTVLDNLIHRLDVAELVAAFVYPRRPAGRVRQLGRARPLPHRGAAAPARGRAPAGRRSRPGGACSGPASARSPRCRPPTAHPTSTASLLLMSGSFVFTDIAAPTTAAGRCSTRW